MSAERTATAVGDGMSRHTGRVTRVVPGRYLYVADTTEDSRDIGLRLDNVLVKRDGELHPYKGETFQELGLREGTFVQLIFNGSGADLVGVIVAPETRSPLIPGALAIIVVVMYFVIEWILETFGLPYGWGN